MERRNGWINVGDLQGAVHFKIVKYERIKFLVIALGKDSIEIYAWAPKPYHKFMSFKVWWFVLDWKTVRYLYSLAFMNMRMVPPVSGFVANIINAHFLHCSFGSLNMYCDTVDLRHGPSVEWWAANGSRYKLSRKDVGFDQWLSYSLCRRSPLTVWRSDHGGPYGLLLLFWFYLKWSVYCVELRRAES